MERKKSCEGESLMKAVFEPFKLAGITFSNKIIRSATLKEWVMKMGSLQIN